jgi:hypothetical protein
MLCGLQIISKLRHEAATEAKDPHVRTTKAVEKFMAEQDKAEKFYSCDSKTLGAMKVSIQGMHACSRLLDLSHFTCDCMVSFYVHMYDTNSPAGCACLHVVKGILHSLHLVGDYN